MANTFKNAAVVLTSTGATDLYTCPSGRTAIVQSVNVANVDSSNRNVTVTLYDSSVATSYTVIYNATIPVGVSMNALSTPLVLEPGDIVRVQASAANTLHATASVMEQDATSIHVDGSITTAKIADDAVTVDKLASSLSATTICTSSTRPASPFEGQKIYETDTNRELTYDASAWVQTVELGAWTSWTPTVTQGSTTFTLSTNDCAYTRFGRTITAQFRVSIGSGTGQTGQGIVMTLPVTPKSSGGPVYGPVWVYDASGGVPYDGTAFRYGAGVGFIGDWSSNQLIGAVPSLIMTTSDEIRGTVTYEAA